MNLNYFVPMHGFNYYLNKGLEEDCNKKRRGVVMNAKAAGLFFYGMMFGAAPIAATFGFVLLEGMNYTTRAASTREFNPIKQIENLIEDGRCVGLLDRLVSD